MDYFVRTLVWIFTIFGVANAFKLAALLEPFRQWLAYSKILKRDDKGNILEAVARKNQFFYKLISCPMCISFWVGILMSIFVWSPTGYDTFFLFRIIADGFLASISGWLLFVYSADKQFKIG